MRLRVQSMDLQERGNARSNAQERKRAAEGLLEALVGEAFVAGGEVDDAAVGEAVAGEEVLHDEVVAVSVDADVWLTGCAEVEHSGEDAMDVREAGDAVDDVIRGDVVQPAATVNG